MGKPKIRFKGYNDEWEQRKLGEVAQEFKSGNFLKADEIDIAGDYPVYGGNGLRGYTSTYNHDGEFALIGRQGALCGNMNYSVGKAYFTEHAVVVEADENNDTRFLYCMLDIMNLGQYSDQSAQPGLAVNKLIKLENFFPQKEEQQQIGWYFNTLDRLITLHQRKYDEMKTLKKYMLQKMFPQNGPKIPKIRFEGFTGEWEQRKLGDIAEFSKGSGYSKGDLIESGTPIILYGRLYTKYETSISEVDTYVEAKDGSVYSKGGEVIVPASGETAEDIARAATVDKSGIILGGDLNVVSPNEDINSAFLAISISHGNSQRELAKKAQGKSVVHIHNEEIKNLVVPFPAKAEQNKIVEYFSNLDDLITLHQRKLEKLQNMKKSCLQKMFPKDGATVPEIRFSEFQGDWEERTLGSCFDERLESLPDGELLSVTIGSGIKKFSELDRHDNSNTDKSKYKRVCIGDIAYNSMRMWQGASGRSPYEGIVSPAYTVVKPIEDFVPNEQYQTDEYVDGVIQDIKKKWTLYSRNRKFHAIFATSSIPEAVKYYRLMVKAFPDLFITAMFDPTIDNEGGGSLEKEDGIVEILEAYNKHFNQKYTIPTYDKFRKEVSLRLGHKKPFDSIGKDEQIDILIVVNQMLTGFDSKFVNTLYLDKMMEYENLIQAFSRTNRLYNMAEKPFGIIKYYRRPNTMEKNIEAAVKAYSGDVPTGLFVDKLPNNLRNMNVLFQSIEQIFKNAGIVNFEKLPADNAAIGKFAK